MATDHDQDQPEAPLLDVNGVGYRYGALAALVKATFQAEAGELIALVGRNGAGKSTLLKCIAGWTQATEGEVKIHGYPVSKNERYVREHLILVPDTPPFYDE